MTDISYPSPAGPVRGHLSVPLGEGPWPGVIVIMDAFGLSRDLRQECDRLASRGYLALAPDLYSWGSKITCIRATFSALRRGSGRAFQDIDAARNWLAERPDCTEKVGVIGFCMGDGFALLAGAQFGFSVSGVNYGQVPKDADSVLQNSCPVVASYGRRDRTLKGQAARLEGSLKRLGVEHDVKEYPAVGHGFMNQHSGAWRRILAFFEQHLRTDERPN